MPEISRFFGVVIAMYYDDHGLPHFHARSGERRVRIRIEPPGLMDGHLPARLLAIVLEWARLHQAELLENWRRARVGERLHRIAPLE